MFSILSSVAGRGRLDPLRPYVTVGLCILVVRVVCGGRLMSTTGDAPHSSVRRPSRDRRRPTRSSPTIDSAHGDHSDDPAMAFPMFSPIQRQESFKLTRKIAKTPTSKSLTLSVKWPHPKSYKANPSTLADAGFYWNPNLAAKDNVTCFFCEENFSDWEVHHDPHVIHYDRCGESCAWATAQCGIFAVDSDSNLK